MAGAFAPLDGSDFAIVSDVKTSRDGVWRVRLATGRVREVDEGVISAHPDFDDKMREFEGQRTAVLAQAGAGRGGAHRAPRRSSRSLGAPARRQRSGRGPIRRAALGEGGGNATGGGDTEAGSARDPPRVDGGLAYGIGEDDDDAEASLSEGDGQEEAADAGEDAARRSRREEDGKAGWLRRPGVRTPYLDSPLILWQSRKRVIFGQDFSSGELYKHSRPTFRKVYETNPGFVQHALRASRYEYSRAQLSNAEAFVGFVGRIEAWEADQQAREDRASSRCRACASR